MELSFAGVRKTGRRRLGRYSQELSLGQAKFNTIEIKDLPVRTDIPHIPTLSHSGLFSNLIITVACY